MNARAAAATAQPRAVLYLRQSVSKEESISLDLQERAGRDYCERMGYRVVGMEEDPGVSGRTWNRPGVRRVMEMIENREADVIVLWKWSRLSRARLDWAVAVDKVESVGGRIESATEAMDTTTSAGRLARGMLAEFAAFESERIGDVWKETLSRRTRSGVPATGGERFGYVKVSKDHYEPDPVTSLILVEAYRLYVEEDWGWTKLTGWLNGLGVRTTAGALWDGAKIRAVLDAGFGAGVLAVGYRSKEVTYLPGNHEAVIDVEFWHAYQRRRQQRGKPGHPTQARSMLAGLIYCGDCDGSMRQHWRKNGAVLVPGYACNLVIRFRDGRRYVTCTQHAVHAAVREWVDALAGDLEGFARIEQQVEQRKVAAINDAAGIARRIAKAKGTLGALTVKWIEGKLTEDAYQAASARLQAELERLAGMESTVQAKPAVELDVRSLAIHVSEIWDEATPNELRALLSKMIAKVVVIPPLVKRAGGGKRVTFDIVPLWES